MAETLVSPGVLARENDTSQITAQPIIVENLMGIRRVKGSIQKGKKPILINHLKLIINVINEQKTEEIKKLRDKSLILIGFGEETQELKNTVVMKYDSKGLLIDSTIYSHTLPLSEKYV